jgi:tetraacyldisaccharide 4'-kinase
MQKGGRLALIPFSWLYGSVIWLRNRGFDLGLLREERVPVPVIAVGNLTAGGTGKTPLVEWLVGRLRERGRTVGVVSRGYGRATTGAVVVSDGTRVLVDARGGGDEPVQMAGKFPGTVVIVAERRVEAARLAVDHYRVDVVVMDDGFQHRYLHRDLNILVVDVRSDLRKERLLPAGMRREGLSAIRRADLIGLSKVPEKFSSAFVAASLSRWYAGPMFAYRMTTAAVRRAPDGVREQVDVLRGKSVFAFCGIADPKRFLDEVQSLGGVMRGSARYPDHHVFSVRDIGELIRGFKESGAEVIVTTEKDIARIGTFPEHREALLARYPVYWTELAVEVVEGEGELMGCLHRVLSGNGGR